MTSSKTQDDNFSGQRILVAEDDPFIALNLEELLTSAGPLVLGPVATVQHALDLLEADRPDAAVLDINLRGQWSTPVVQRLQATGIPFVITTGYSRSQIDEPILRDAPIIFKPAQDAVLLRELRRLLSTTR